MKRWFCLVALLASLSAPFPALGEFDPAGYEPILQSDLVRNPEQRAGKKFRVTDPYQFCGSDFCVQIHKTKINTREYYCVTLGLSLVRMYVKKDHPDAAAVTKLKRGDKVTVYGTFDHIGSDYKFLIVDHLEVAGK